MFDVPDSKAFMDAVHGYINIPKIFVENIIDTKEFQRLHYVDQTGIRPVYPGVRHSRFIHSIGVYYLGFRAVDALLDNFKGDKYWNIRSDNSVYVFWAKNKVLFLIACLLHDIGHAPFSHSMEQFFVNGGNEDTLRSMLACEFKISEQDSEYSDIFNASPHEQMSALMVLRIFREPVRRILDALNKEGYPEIQYTTYAEHRQKPPSIDISEIDDDMLFIARMILGVKYRDYRPEYQIRNCFIELLNGKNFDVDKLDYIIRDTEMSGISNISLDVERLLSSLTIVPITNYSDFEFVTPFSPEESVFLLEVEPKVNGLLEFDGTVGASFSFRKHRVIVYPGTSFSMFGYRDTESGTSTYATIRLLNEGYFSQDSKIKQLKNSKYKTLSPSPDSQSISIPYSKDEETIIFEDAVTISSPFPDGKPFSFEIDKSVATFALKGNSKVSVAVLEGGSGSILSSSRFTGKITGSIEKLKVIGDQLCDLIPTDNAYISFSIGYKKQAINIITNVMDARDYLYLWIYAHHKVVYYANYLVVELPRLCYAILHKDGDRGFEDLFSYNTFTEISLDEPYILHLIRDANEEHIRWKKESGVRDEQEQIIHQRFEVLYEEFISRRYKKSLYKSLAEYDIFFRDFTYEEKLKIRNSLPGETKVDPSAKYTSYINGQMYGVWDKNILEEKKITTLEWLVWVDPLYNRKNIDRSKLYIYFGKEAINAEYIPILHKEDDENISNFDNYFYLYYQPKEFVEKDDISREIKTYFKGLTS